MPDAEQSPPRMLPDWVPPEVIRYLCHVAAGQPIRDLAREAGCHASTVLRQIRRMETRRDDALIDEALSRLARAAQATPGALFAPAACRRRQPRKEDIMSRPQTCPIAAPDTATLHREARRILRRLCETGSMLAVAQDMEKAVVVRDGADGRTMRTAVVPREVAQAMALQDWIACETRGRISRYRITQVGRAALERMIAESPDADGPAGASGPGCAEAQSPFAAQHRDWADKPVQDDTTSRPRKLRYNLAESPLTALARRKDRDGEPFLSDDLVHAGERLREDFELAQMGPRVAQNWDRFLTGGGRGGFAPDGGVGDGPSSARARVSRALTELGPGLSDVALRCCCFLEGLEAAEKRMGWSARSGKIVLRIALQRLRRHYDGLAPEASMIG